MGSEVIPDTRQCLASTNGGRAMHGLLAVFAKLTKLVRARHKYISKLTISGSALIALIAIASGPAQAQAIQGYQMVPGAFINGSGIGGAEKGHTAWSCAARCNRHERCLSFEITEGWCSINMRSTQTDPNILSRSPKYNYYERTGASSNVTPPEPQGYEARWRKIGPGPSWSSQWTHYGPNFQATYGRRVCGHGNNCACGAQSYCTRDVGPVGAGETVLWWPQGCQSPAWTLVCEVR